MEITIEMVSNGWKIKQTNDDGYLTEKVYQNPVEYSSIGDDLERKAELDKFVEVLHDIIELVGPSYDGFSKYNIAITTDNKGDEI